MRSFLCCSWFLLTVGCFLFGFKSDLFMLFLLTCLLAASAFAFRTLFLAVGLFKACFRSVLLNMFFPLFAAFVFETFAFWVFP